MDAYSVLRPPRHETLRIRGLDIHVRRWGPDPSRARAPVFLLHGFQDTGDTFQFMVDAFSQDWPLVALDWRGFGLSDWAKDGTYWFPDYLADLDAVLDALDCGAPARLLGHSMGGNVATLYAGLRPQRVRCLINLEGFGMPRTTPEQAPAHLRKWLDQVRSVPPLKDYDSFEQLASIIEFRNPRFGAQRCHFIARAWARLEADGRVRLLGDSRHRWINPILYNRDHAEAIWRQIKCPMLMLLSEHSDYLRRLGPDATPSALTSIIPGIEVVRIAGAGHMLHIERPDLIAPVIEEFLSAH